MGCKRLFKKAIRIRSDHGKTFENPLFIELCNKHGIDHEYFAPKTLQHDSVVERKDDTRNGLGQAKTQSTIHRQKVFR